MGVGFGLQSFKFRKESSWKTLAFHYSIFQNGFSVNYKSLKPKAIGSFDFSTKAYYDQVRWVNFFGLGNETVRIKKDVDFHRVRSTEGFAQLGLAHNLGKHNRIAVSGFYQSVDIKRDSARFIAKTTAPVNFDQDNFIGARFEYSLSWVNDSVVPTSGITFNTNAAHTHDLERGSSFQRYSGYLKLYIPIVSRFVSVAIGAGASTVEGKPQFYQYPSLGESYNLRGFRRERFYGKSSFYNTNELRFITKFKSYIFNGGIGIMGFYDVGRVWMPNEKSDSWHTSVGGGLILIPFKLVMAQITYGVSKEDQLLQIKVKRDF